MGLIGTYVLLLLTDIIINCISVYKNHMGMTSKFTPGYDVFYSRIVLQIKHLGYVFINLDQLSLTKFETFEEIENIVLYLKIIEIEINMNVIPGQSSTLPLSM